MKSRILFISELLLALGFTSCVEDDVITTSNQLVKTISVTGQDFQSEEAVTKATYTVDGTGMHFSWTEGDTVGIYPVGGDQVAFPISSGEGGQTAQFDGGAWALRSTYSYAAYYPFSSGNYHVDETRLPVSFIGQSQNGNGSLDNLDRFDYQASSATRPDADGNVNISLKHLGCFVRFQLTMPVADTYKSITLQSSKTPFVTSGTYDLTKENVVITTSSTSSSFTVELNNTSTTVDNKVLTVYAMLAPSDFSDSEITIIIAGTKNQSYSVTLNGKNMLASKAYSFAAIVKSGTNINGSDVEWDDNGEEIEKYEFVDLGLSVNWATFNVGATAPEEYGNYYAWAGTETNELYDWSTYQWCQGSYETLTKYCYYSDYGYNGFVDNKTIIDSEDDVVSLIWGGNWRIPTIEEYKELIYNCTWTWTTLNGVKGYKIKSKKEGYTASSIFLPASGYFDESCNKVGTTGCYWSNTLDTDAPDGAFHLDFTSKNKSYSALDPRYLGLTVRPVFTSEEWLNNLSITLDNKKISLNTTEKVKLISTVENSNEVINYFTVTWSSDDSSIATVNEDGVITGIAAGTTTINASCHGKTVSCIVTVYTSKYHSGHAYVDLGLSVKWATCNVGSLSPEEYGDFYAWGETETYYETGGAQLMNPTWKDGKLEGYKASSYKYCNGTYTTLTKYNNDNRYGIVDNISVLKVEDDVANVVWGGNWHMPSLDQINELIDNCSWVWTTLNGINGYKVISKKNGYTDRFIFLPVAGYRGGTSYVNYGYSGSYWTNTMFDGTTYCYLLSLFPDNNIQSTNQSRFDGLSVRPVYK